VPIILTFLVLDLALPVRVVAEMLPVMVGRRRRFPVVWRRARLPDWRRGRFAGVWWRRTRFAVVRRRRTRLRDGLHRRPQREDQEHRDGCDLSFSHTDLDSSLSENQGTSRRWRHTASRGRILNRARNARCTRTLTLILSLTGRGEARRARLPAALLSGRGEESDAVKRSCVLAWK
jgi:hypothetical protein